jgi:hypothetical protein
MNSLVPALLYQSSSFTCAEPFPDLSLLKDAGARCQVGWTPVEYLVFSFLPTAFLSFHHAQQIAY